MFDIPAIGQAFLLFLNGFWYVTRKSGAETIKNIQKLLDLARPCREIEAVADHGGRLLYI
ncbi:hypothetical protein [Thalassospira sp.]|uniref:hypothetical protein n=1 Tax=Thalassospira sp. TaxID=1912094 RepID=UPI0027327C96|nr:hypothetical protein [Thalassospira sp.]MDP2697457.1 hypothetical protein [Thalassospira sp.]